MLDRGRRCLSRYFEEGPHLQGSPEAGEGHVRAGALVQNVRPWGPEAVRENQGWHRPAERRNDHRDHDDGLQNLLISASLGGYRC